MHQPTACVDLDGTIFEYDRWRGEQFFGELIPGAKEALKGLRDAGWRVIIYTTRGSRDLVGAALLESGVPYDYINENPDQPPGCSGKPIADVYVDDRAVGFRGDWEKALLEVEQFRPYA